MRVYGVEIGGTVTDRAREWRNKGSRGTVFSTQDVVNWIRMVHGQRVETQGAWQAATRRTEESRGRRTADWRRA